MKQNSRRKVFLYLCIEDSQFLASQIIIVIFFSRLCTVFSVFTRWKRFILWFPRRPRSRKSFINWTNLPFSNWICFQAISKSNWKVKIQKFNFICIFSVYIEIFCENRCRWLSKTENTWNSGALFLWRNCEKRPPIKSAV